MSRLNALRGPAIILAAAVIAVGPLLWHGPTCGSDFGFHFISWIDAEHSMSKGVLYPHWANSPNFGAGDPRFVFYPPLSWMAGAVLGMCLPWSFVRLALFILLLAAAGMANRALARQALADGPATLAGCAAIFLGYPLFNVYKRCDFAELAGGFWIPLLLLFALRRRNPSGNFWARTFDGSAAPLALVVAGAWLSNGPVGIMAGYLLAAVALVSAFIEKSPVALVRAAVSTFTGLGLASLYLIPAVWERNWASIQYAVTLSHFVVESSWLFARHAAPDMVSHDMLLHRVSKVAVGMLAVAFGGGVVAWIRGTVPGERRWSLPLALIPPAVLFLLLPISQPVWNVLPELRLLQFPWRWLVVLEAPMAICFASAVWFDRRTLRIPLMAACAAVFVGISLAAAQWWFVECATVETSLQESVREGAGVLGKPEYAPPGVRFPLVDRIVHSACLLDGFPDASVQREAGLAPAWDGEEASCKSSAWSDLVLIPDPSHLETAMYLPEQRQIAGFADHAGDHYGLHTAAGADAIVESCSGTRVAALFRGPGWFCSVRGLVDVHSRRLRPCQGPRRPHACRNHRICLHLRGLPPRSHERLAGRTGAGHHAGLARSRSCAARHSIRESARHLDGNERPRRNPCAKTGAREPGR